MTQSIEAMRARAGKVIEEVVVAWDWWEDGASDEEVSEILSRFIAEAVAFRTDAACDPAISSLPSLEALAPAIAATQLADGFNDFFDKCQALGDVMAEVQHELGGRP